MEKKITPRELSRLHYLFDNDHPDHVWANTIAIVRKINPNYDFTRLHQVFNDIVDLFYGDYDGYRAIKTPYHDLRHTMDVYICALRLTHGFYLSGGAPSDDEITQIGISALAHDIGYAQTEEEEEAGGTGAVYTKTHVSRGIEFMREYMNAQSWHPTWIADMEAAILCTNPAIPFADIAFASDRARDMARIVGTADLVGQMADRSYLEKLLFLYTEFKEAEIGGFANVHDLLAKTHEFYAVTKNKLDVAMGRFYEYLLPHFREWFNVETNYYMDSIDKNINYLLRVISESNEQTLFDNLKRRGIAGKAARLVG